MYILQCLQQYHSDVKPIVNKILDVSKRVFNEYGLRLCGIGAIAVPVCVIFPSLSFPIVLAGLYGGFKLVSKALEELGYEHQDVTHAQQAIGLVAKQLHQKLAAEGKSVCFSPLSIFPVLCMVAEALHPVDRDLFLRSLGLDEIGLEGIRKELKAIFAKNSLPEMQKEFNFKSANGIAIAGNIMAGFTAKMQKEYNAEVFECSQNKEEACNDINKWVANKTDSKISELLKSENIPQDLAVVLLNAIYFSATWQYQFSYTKSKPFDFEDGTTMDVPMMKMEEAHQFKYNANQSCEMLEIPFKTSKGHNLSCIIFLPKDKNDLSTIENSLDLSFIKKNRQGAIDRTFNLELPKIDMSEKIDDLIPALMELGGIQPEVYLPGIGKKIKLSSIVHQAKLKMDENGVEGAAATAAMAYRESAFICPSFIVDHAYAYVIMSDDTIIFQGSVKDEWPFVIDNQV